MSIEPIGAISAYAPAPPPRATDPISSLPENVRDGSLVADTYGSAAIASTLAAHAFVSSFKAAPLVAAVEPLGQATRGRRIDVYA